MAKHFDKEGNEIRCVYLAEFTDNFVYIGTTSDYEERVKQHHFQSKNPSEVFSHKRHTGLIPQFTMLHDYTSIEESNKLEDFYTIHYACQGKQVLNKQSPGGYGPRKSGKTSTKRTEIRLEGRLSTNAYNNEESVNSPHFNHKEESSYIDEDEVAYKKLFDIIRYICIRAKQEKVDTVYISRQDLPIDYKQTDWFRYCTKTQNKNYLCNIHSHEYYIECYNILVKQLQQIGPNEYLDEYEKIYNNCYLFRFSKELETAFEQGLTTFNDTIVKLVSRHSSTIPFNESITIEELGYTNSMNCNKEDYVIYWSKIRNMTLPIINFEVTKSFEISSININFWYNAYTTIVSRLNPSEIEDQAINFTKLVEATDKFVYEKKLKDEIKQYPIRVEINANTMQLKDIDSLRIFMRHYYIRHGIVLNTDGSPDFCICSISNYNGCDLANCKFNIDIQNEDFFECYDFQKHELIF